MNEKIKYVENEIDPQDVDVEIPLEWSIEDYENLQEYDDFKDIIDKMRISVDKEREVIGPFRLGSVINGKAVVVVGIVDGGRNLHVKFRTIEVIP